MPVQILCGPLRPLHLCVESHRQPARATPPATLERQEYRRMYPGTSNLSAAALSDW